MIGYIYCVINNVTKENYIGRHNYKTNEDWNSYMGSGRKIRDAIDSYGKDNFTKILIEECEDIITLMEREEYWLKYYKDKGKAEYNISLSGGLSSLSNYWPYLDGKDSQEISAKLSNSLKNSEVYQKAILKHHESVKIKNEEKRLELISKHSDEVISLYKSGKSMKEIFQIVDIQKSLIRRILVEGNVVKYDKNGNIAQSHTEETKAKIAKSLEEYSLNSGKTKYDYDLLNKQETIDKIIKLHEQGKSLRAIGKIYNVRGQRIKKILKDNNAI